MVEAVTAATAEGSSPEEPPILLHNDLDLWIFEACNLSNMDMISEHLHRFFAACHPPSPSSYTRSRRPPHHHRRHPKIISSDPYVTIFKIPLTHHSPFIFHVKDSDIFSAELIGIVSIPATLVASNDPIRDWYPVLSPFGKPPKLETALLVSLQYRPIDGNPIHVHGIADDPEKLGVRSTYFPVRKGGLVTLYQDVHVRVGAISEIELEKRMNFEHNKYWEDICRAILEAHHLIYIIGWLVYDKVKLVREPTRPLPPGVENFTLGELLKYKLVTRRGSSMVASLGR